MYCVDGGCVSLCALPWTRVQKVDLGFGSEFLLTNCGTAGRCAEGGFVTERFGRIVSPKST